MSGLLAKVTIDQLCTL